MSPLAQRIIAPIAILLCLAASLPSAFADGGKGRPEPTNDRNSREIRANTAAGDQAWRTAMDALGAPYLLVSFGVDSGNPERALGLNLEEDELAYTTQLAAAVQNLMLRAYPDTEFIDQDEVRAAKTRAAADLREAGLDAAIDQVMRQVDADLAIIGTFTPQPDGTLVLNMKVVDPRRARSYPIRPATLNLQVFSIDRVAAALYRRIAEQFELISRRGAPRYDIDIIGDLGDKNLRGVQRHVADLEWVESAAGEIRPLRQADRLRLTRVRYDGWPLDLGYEVADMLAEEYGIRARVAFSDGNVTLTVFENQEPPEWWVLTDTATSETRETFQALYAERGQPRFAFLVNQAPFIATGDDQVDRTIRRGPIIIRALAAELLPMENAVAGRLLEAGIDVTGGSQIRDLFAAQLADTDNPMRQQDLVTLLRDRGGFDVLVIGTPVMRSGGDLPGLSLRAIQLDSDRVLGTAVWPTRDASRDPDYRVNPENPDRETVARYLAGSLASMFLRTHLKQGSLVDVRVKGARSLRQIRFIAESVTDVIPESLYASNIRFERGIGNFTLRYEGSRSDLIQNFNAALDLLPIESIVDAAGPGVLEVRAQPLDDQP